MPIISSIVFTKKDISGNQWVEAHILFEFRNAYVPGGEAVDLTPFFQRVELPVGGPNIASGQASGYLPRVNAADIPGNPGSSRIQLFYGASGIVTLNISGIGVSVASGTLLTTSGIAGVQSGFAVIGTLHSGSISATASGVLGVGVASVEVLSGQATSGFRTYQSYLGY